MIAPNLSTPVSIVLPPPTPAIIPAVMVAAPVEAIEGRKLVVLIQGSFDIDELGVP